MSQTQRTNEDTDETADEEQTDDDPNANPQTTDELQIDRQPGSGSLSRQEAWASESAQSRSASNDGRYDTRTTFYYNGDGDDPEHLKSRDRHQRHRDPADRRSWSQLAKWNDGMRDIDGSRKQQNFEADVRRWIQTFCNQLDCNQSQIERVKYIVTNEIDIDTFRGQRLSVETVILGTISLVVDADTDAENPEDFDLDDWIIYRDRFEELMDAVDMDRDDLWYVRKIVHDRTETLS